MSDWADWSEYIEYEKQFMDENHRKWLFEFRRDNKYKAKNYVLMLLNRWGDYDMARGKTKQATTTNRGTNQWTKFLDVPLTGVELSDIVDEYRDDNTLYDAVQAVLVSNHRISFSYNASNDTMMVSITCRDDESVNNGITFTSYSGDWYTALQVALYKFHRVLPARWTDVEGKSDRPIFG